MHLTSQTPASVRCFTPPTTLQHRRCRARSQVKARSSGHNEGDGKDPGFALKAAWGLAEAGGNLRAKILGESGSEATAAREQKQPPISRQDAVAAIREDFDSVYFVSGKGKLAAYDDNCLFKDDFAGFRGVDRFKKNVSNLGGLTENVDLKITSWDEQEDSLKAGWRFSAIVDVPWRPRLAAAGATTYVFDSVTGRVVEHIEEWNVEPSKVFKQLISPANRPTDSSSRWEQFMWSASKGKPLEAWTVVSRQALLAGGAAVAVSLLLQASGVDAILPGWLVSSSSVAAWALFLAGAGGESAKFTK